MEQSGWINFLLGNTCFVSICLLSMKGNLNRTKRNRQCLMPFIALIYCTVIVIYLDKIISRLIHYMGVLSEYLPFLAEIDLVYGIFFVANVVIMLGFVSLKAMILPITNLVWDRIKNMFDFTTDIFYEFHEEHNVNLLKNKWGQLKTYFKGFYFTAVALSVLLFGLFRANMGEGVFTYPAYPVFGIIVLGEIFFFLGGFTFHEFIEIFLGEKEEAETVTNYSQMRTVYRKLFGDRILYEDTMDNYTLNITDNSETVDSYINSGLSSDRVLGVFLAQMQKQGRQIHSDLSKSASLLLQGKSVFFTTPFYQDLIPYVFFPMNQQLLQHNKCLVVLGRHSTETEIQKWVQTGLSVVTNVPALWSTQILSEKGTVCDVGILPLSEVYNLKLYGRNEDFLKKVTMVVLLEPSEIIATGQMGLSVLVDRIQSRDKKIAYCACDRNVDGLLDSMSHILKTNMVEVSATNMAYNTCSHVVFDVDGEYLHHRVFSGVSRYLGVGTELSAAALQNQVRQVQWYSSNAIPLLDIHWLYGQYYKTICDYVGFPPNQGALDEAFHFIPHLWGAEKKENAFMVVEDEYNNVFEISRQYTGRASRQGFVCILAPNYLLRDYMRANQDIFIADPKAVPAIMPDYARTGRNVALKMIMLMAAGPLCEMDVERELMVAGIPVTDVYETLIGLIKQFFDFDKSPVTLEYRNEFIGDVFCEQIRYYKITDMEFIQQNIHPLQNAYFVAEDEKGNTHYLGGKLLGHVYQSFLPGQFITFAGKYYEVLSITQKSGVLLRRASEFIKNRRYYRQLRNYVITDTQWSDSMEDNKTISGIQVNRGTATITVSTQGYLETECFNNIRNAKCVRINGIPDRTYRRKHILRVALPDSGAKVCQTITLLLNEVFRTVFSETCSYISAITPTAEDLNALSGLFHGFSSDEKDVIYLIEDSQTDLGLGIAAERNLKRLLEIVCDYLSWLKEGGTSRYLHFGFDAPPEAIDSAGALQYLQKHEFHKNPLKQARDKAHEAEKLLSEYNPRQEDVHFCDFCGIELSGAEYDVLSDKRERCNRCSKTAVKTIDELKNIYKTVHRNMETLYGIKINTSVKVQFVSASKVARKAQQHFIPTPGFDSRVTGVAIEDKHGYTILIENSAPKLSTVATIAHELTHIWQYLWWDTKAMIKKYGRKGVLEIYEGMAKWAEIQYLLLINEKARAKREEIVTRLSEDVYGKGFLRFIEVYPFSQQTYITGKTPFDNKKLPLE